MFTTLISTDQLAAHLDDPSFVVVDVRHDVAQPEHWGENAYCASHVPSARFGLLQWEFAPWAPEKGERT